MHRCTEKRQVLFSTSAVFQDLNLLQLYYSFLVLKNMPEREWLTCGYSAFLCTCRPSLPILYLPARMPLLMSKEEHIKNLACTISLLGMRISVICMFSRNSQSSSLKTSMNN